MKSPMASPSVLALSIVCCAHLTAAVLPIGTRSLQLSRLAETPWGHQGEDVQQSVFLEQRSEQAATPVALVERFDITSKIGGGKRRRANNTWVYIGVGTGVLLLIIGGGAFVAMRKSSPAAAQSACGSTSDTSIVLHPRYKVPPGKMAEFKAIFIEFHDNYSPKEEGLLYFGFTVDEFNGMVYGRQGFKDAAGLRAHLTSSDKRLKEMSKIGKLESIEAHGPATALDELKDVLTPLGCKYFVSNAGNRMFKASTPESWDSGHRDKSILFCPRYKIPEGKMDEFVRIFDEVYNSMKPEEEGALFFGFAVNRQDGVVICHEAYESSDGLLQHMGNVDSILKEALKIGELDSIEVHGQKQELGKLRAPLGRSDCTKMFFEADEGCRTWLLSKQAAADLDLENVDVQELLKNSGDRMVGKLQRKLEKGSKVRDMVEEHAYGFTDRAKDWVMAEMNNTADALLKAFDEEEAIMTLQFNEAVEASFPRLPVLLAGLISPTVLSMEMIGHMLQFFGLFLPVFLGTAWSIYEDAGETCGIPGMIAWGYVAFASSLLLALGHGILFMRTYSGRAAVAAKSAEIRKRLDDNAADGETSFSDMQEIFIGLTVLVQENILLENRVRKSFWGNVVGIGTLLWLVVATWNFILVIGWTFLPYQIAFHHSAKHVAGDDYCGAWATVFTARVVCLLTPLFFFMNILSTIKWIVVTVLHSSAVSSALISAAKSFDDSNTGIPVLQVLIKGFILRAQTDLNPTKITIALGEALRLTREKEDMEEKLQSVEGRLRACREERMALKETALKCGDDMKSNIDRLEKSGEEDHAHWKKKGRQLAEKAEAKADALKGFTTAELDKIVQHIMELAQEVKDSEMVKAALEQGRQRAEEAHAAAMEAQKAAAEGLAQAQSAAESGLAEAQKQAQAGLEYAQSDEVQASLAQARDATMAQARDAAGQAQQLAGQAQGQAQVLAGQAQQAAGQAQQQAQVLAAQAQQQGQQLAAQAQQQGQELAGQAAAASGQAQVAAQRLGKDAEQAARKAAKDTEKAARGAGGSHG